MLGLCLEARVALCAALERRVLDQPRLPDGRLALLLTAADARFLSALALDFYNGATGRCDAGLRAIARKGRMVVSTAGLAAHRLQRAGWITWRRILVYVHGTLRFGRRYILAGQPPELRPRSGPKPGELSKRLRSRAVDKPTPQAPQWSAQQQMAAALAWAAESLPAGGQTVCLGRADRSMIAGQTSRGIPWQTRTTAPLRR